MNAPNPALVTERAVQRLPRAALLLFCAAYVLPGLFGRDPWKNADITAFGYMVNLAQGKTEWLAPSVAGVPSDAALLPYWLGAAFIRALGPWVDPALAARLPFGMLLVVALVLTWYSTYHLARTEAAQPLPFAFGGEANPIGYARAIADGALLALIASLGLLQLGHETTPELAQLASMALFLYALASSPFRGLGARLAVLVALPALAASGAPSIGLAAGLAGAVVSWNSNYPQVRRFALWVLLAVALAAATAWALGAWGWRLSRLESPQQVLGIVRQLAWFLWPAWPLAFWTVWRWRAQWLNRHIAVPLSCALVGIGASVVMGGYDRALMLALPSMAVLAAFALPTLKRGTAAAIDWFSVFFFSVCALVIWIIYAAMQTGVPAQPAANVAKLAPGFVSSFSLTAVLLAGAGTLAWLWLVRWRTGRNRHPLWKSLVLPASGVALCWLLLMTLWLPLLDYARSYRPLVERIARHVPKAACIAAPGLPRGLWVALEYVGGYRVDGLHPADQARCDYLLRTEYRGQPAATVPGWTLLALERRPTDREELTAIYRRSASGR